MTEGGGGGHLQYFTNLKVLSNDDCEPPVHSSTDHRYGAVRHLSLDYYGTQTNTFTLLIKIKQGS